MKRELRERISEALDQISDASLKSLVEDALSVEKTVWREIACKNCKRTYKYPIDIPDIQARAKVLDILATQGKGKPQETKKIDVDVQVRSVEGMTVAELEAEESRLVRELEAAS